MKRLTYRTALASLLTANGVCLAILFPQAVRTQPDGALFEAIAAVCFLYAGAVALVYACRAAWHVGRADACRYAHRRQRPSNGRPATAAVVVEPPAAEQQHAEAIAAVAAEPMQSQHIDDTADMPKVVTTGVTWGFGPTVMDAPPPPWTAPDEATFDTFAAKRSEARRARHAVPEELPAALQEFDWEPAGVAR